VARKRTIQLFLVLFTISALIHLIDIYQLYAFQPLILTASRWAAWFMVILFAVRKKSLTTWILVSMIIGVEIGLNFPAFAQNLQVLSKIFLRLIKTIIAPILFATLVVGIAGHSNLKQVGRMGWKSILYFELITTLALVVGILAINISKAGVGITLPEGFNQDLPEAVPQTWDETILHIFPENFIKSIYHGEVLPVVVFSILFGISLAMLPEARKKPVLDFTEGLAETMFKFTNIIMHFAPFGVGAAIAVTVGHLGLDILMYLLKLLFTLYGALLVL